MTENFYSIYDRVSGLYQFPFPATNDACAERYFKDVCSRSYIGSDCELYFVGFFDTDTGIVSSIDKPVFISRYEVKE